MAGGHGTTFAGLSAASEPNTTRSASSGTGAGATSPTANVPVVVLSADATPSQIERLLAAGARNYLTKPFDIDPFLAVVDEMVAAA